MLLMNRLTPCCHSVIKCRRVHFNHSTMRHEKIIYWEKMLILIHTIPLQFAPVWVQIRAEGRISTGATQLA
jgi:hypothetical protein